jgi:hypothetical protein
MTVDQVFSAAQELSPDAKSELINRLLMQQTVAPELESAHLRIVHARRDAYRAGDGKLLDGQSVLESLRLTGWAGG